MSRFILLILTLLFSFSVMGSDEFEECTAASIGPAAEQLAGTNLTMDAFSRGIWSCTKNLFKGAWDSTGGAVVDAAKCARHPIDCAHSAVEGAKHAWAFVKDLEKSLVQMGQAINSLSVQQKIDAVCEMVGSIGAPILIAILTAGGGSALVAKVLQSITEKLIKVARIIKRIPNAGVRKIVRLAEDVLIKVEELTHLGYDNVIKEALELCPL